MGGRWGGEGAPWWGVRRELWGRVGAIGRSGESEGAPWGCDYRMSISSFNLKIFDFFTNFSPITHNAALRMSEGSG